MANILSLGKVPVPTPGTPVALSSDPTVHCAKIILSQVPGATGKTYFGKAGLSKSTLAGVVGAFLPPAATGLLDTREIAAEEDGGNPLRLSDYAVDADTAGEGILVSYVQR
jgi:hypothetical protein